MIISLKNCPFCKSTASYRIHFVYDWFTLGCDNIECIAFEMCPDWDCELLDNTIEKWNYVDE